MAEHTEKELGMGGAVLIVLCVLAVYAFVSNQDYLEAVAREGATNAASASCVPETGQMTISIREPDGRISCTVQTKPEYGQVAARVRSNCM